MKYFERKKTIEVDFIDGKFVTEVTFVDDHHNVKLQLIVNDEMRILNAEVIIIKEPFKTCDNLKTIVKRSIGEKIERGFSKRLKEIFGGSDGCTHLVDIFMDAARGVVQAELKYIYEKQGKDAFWNELKGSCISYSNEDNLNNL